VNIQKSVLCEVNTKQPIFILIKQPVFKWKCYSFLKLWWCYSSL